MRAQALAPSFGRDTCEVRPMFVESTWVRRFAYFVSSPHGSPQQEYAVVLTCILYPRKLKCREVNPSQKVNPPSR